MARRRIQLGGGATYFQEDDGLFYREGSNQAVTDVGTLQSLGLGSNAGMQGTRDELTRFTENAYSDYFKKIGKPSPIPYGQLDSTVASAQNEFNPYMGEGSAFQKGIRTPETDFYKSYLSGSFTGTGGVSPEDYGRRQELGASYTPIKTISSDVLTLGTDLSRGISYPNESTPYDVRSIIPSAGGEIGAGTGYELTPEEKKQQELTNRIGSAYKDLVGESAFRKQQESQQGVTELQRTQRELSAKLSMLRGEADSIRLSAARPGQTAGMLNAEQNEKLRQNATEALTTAALLEAANGNLSLANDLVDRAVAERFNPIKERIQADERNLALIKNSPEATMQEKKRADARALMLARQKKQLDEAEDIVTYNEKLGLELIKNGVTDQNLISRVQKATTKEEGLRLATQSGRTNNQITNNLGGDIQSYLAEQGLPLTIATIKGDLTTSALNKTVSAGVPLEIARHIWDNVKAGNNFEEIRQGLLQEFGKDNGYKYLDLFVSALQGNKSDEKAEDGLEELLKEL